MSPRLLVAAFLAVMLFTVFFSSGIAQMTPDVEMVSIKGGCFQMGNTFEDQRSDEKPVHEVCVDDFRIAKYLVTQAEWRTIMGNNPSHFRKCGDNCPVERISWNDVQSFLKKLNEKTGKHYRLPTEAEWEYAARSGGKREEWAGTSKFEDLDEYAWYADNAEEETHPVGQKKPNGLGIYDMSGNVYEWMADWYKETYYRESPRNNPKGPESGVEKVIRGGSWLYVPTFMHVSSRNKYGPDCLGFSVGFRLAETLVNTDQTTAAQ